MNIPEMLPDAAPNAYINLSIKFAATTLRTLIVHKYDIMKPLMKAPTYCSLDIMYVDIATKNTAKKPVRKSFVLGHLFGGVVWYSIFLVIVSKFCKVNDCKW